MGSLFVVIIPRKEHEEDLKQKEISAKLAMEKEKYEQTSTLIRGLKKNKRSENVKSTFESYIPGDRVIIKCKSTESLNEGVDFSLSKSKSDNVLSESYKLAVGDSQFRKKSSWRDIKQIIRKKLRITQPPSITDVITAFDWDTSLEIILSEVITRLEISNATWTSTKENKHWQVLFTLESSKVCEELLQTLRNLGIGSRYRSSVSVVPCACALHYKGNCNEEERECVETEYTGRHSGGNSARSRFSSSVRARTNLARILYDVRAEAALTFDWQFLLIVAAFIAAIGLVENSTVILVASMLISPLMGPITAGTLGTAVRDRSLQHMGVLHELLGLFLALVIGFIFGLIICTVDERYEAGDWPTYEMMARCEIRSLWVGVLVATSSGAGVALAVLGENTASLVGVAISASLLPPAVNAGLLWAMALVHLIFTDDKTRWTGVLTTNTYSRDQPTELAVLGAVSFCLTLVNIGCIFITGVAVYKVKKVCPLERRDILWWTVNRKSHQASERLSNNNITCEKYSNWSNDSSKAGQEKEPIHITQSETVTFRHETPTIGRMRAQNVDAYSVQKQEFTSMPNNFEANTPDRHIYNSIENLSTLKDMSSRIPKKIENGDFYNNDCIRSLDNVNSFCNAGFEELENFVNNDFEQNNEHSQCPIIEPNTNQPNLT